MTDREIPFFQTVENRISQFLRNGFLFVGGGGMLTLQTRPQNVLFLKTRTPLNPLLPRHVTLSLISMTSSVGHVSRDHPCIPLESHTTPVTSTGENVQLRIKTSPPGSLRKFILLQLQYLISINTL